MSATSVETILPRPLKSEFAELLFANFEQALAGCYLSAEEIAQFKKMSRAASETINPDVRNSNLLAREEKPKKVLRHPISTNLF